MADTTPRLPGSFPLIMEIHRLLELVAIGPDTDQTWRRRLTPEVVIRLGRAPVDGWSVPWDRRISREHANLILKDDRLVVKCLESALNTPVVKRERKREFSIESGQQFRIGLTIFRLEAADNNRKTVTDHDAPTDHEDESPWPAWQLRHSPVHLDVDQGDPETSPEPPPDPLPELTNEPPPPLVPPQASDPEPEEKQKKEEGHTKKEEGHTEQRFRPESDSQFNPPQSDSRNLVPLFFSVNEEDDFDPYHRWLGISPSDRPIDCYRLIGVARYESDADVIEASADRQMTHIRNYQMGQRAHLTQLLLNELATARLCLLCPEAKAEYDRRLKQYLASRVETEREGESAGPPPNVSINLARFLDGLSDDDQHWKKKKKR